MLQESMDAYQALSDGEFTFGDVASVAGVGMAALGAFLDPAGALVGAALGPLLDWVANNVSFVKEPLDMLLGDPPEISAYAQGWAQTAAGLGALCQEHLGTVQQNIGQWTGLGAEAFLKVQDNLAKAFEASARMADIMSKAVQGAGMIVGVLRELVWGMVKELSLIHI